MITRSGIKSLLIPWIAIGVILFLSHFLLVTEFGLYEDDYFYVLPRLTENFQQFTAYFFHALRYSAQGRPLLDAFQGALAYFGYHAGGLAFCHLISFGFLWVSGILLYQLLSPKLSPRAAFLGALLLVLFPLDTSRQILMHQMATIIPMTVLLCAFHLYVARRFFLSYLVAATLLVTYESSFLPFIVAPFFLEEEPRERIKSFVIHAIIFGATIGLVFGARAFWGEPRAVEMGLHLSEEIPKILWSCIANPALGILVTVARPIDALMHSRAEGVVVAVLAGAISFYVLYRLRANTPDQTSTPAVRRAGWPILLAGIIAWVVVYVLDFRQDYYPPGITIGRLSAMHGIAGFGAAMVLAAIVFLIIDPLLRRWRIAIDIGGTLFIAGLSAFGFHIQEAEYVTNWQQQRDFWLELAPLIQDARPGDNIVLETEFRWHGFIPHTQGFTSNQVVIYPSLAFPYFYDFTVDSKHPPTFHGYAEYIKVSENDGEIVIQSPFFDPARFAHIRGDNLIFLRAQEGVVQRIAGQITLGGHTMFARPMSPASGNPVKLSGLFWNLFEPHGSNSWFTVRSARSYPSW
jgi:hypothetical protein